MQAYFTPRRSWTPLTDAEWAVLAPYMEQGVRPGRRLGDVRGRFEAVLHNALSGEPWRMVPERFGKPDTISRQFRRWARAGVFGRLLEAVAAPGAPAVLRRMEYWLCRLARRAMRVLGMAGLALARRLGLNSALPMVPWFLPNPELSESLIALSLTLIRGWPERRPKPGLLTLIGKVLVTAGGRAVWSRRFAPA